MFGIGFSELLVIAVVAIVFVGPKRLPEVMKQLGRFFVHARRMSNEVRSTFDSVVHQAEQEIHLENLKKIKEMTKGTLVNPLLEERPHVPHPDDHQHMNEHAKPAQADSSLADQRSNNNSVDDSHGTKSDSMKPEFDSHNKV